MPVDLYLNEGVEGNDAEESNLELNGALWFVSLLSRVDGLVLLRPDLTVSGFGVEITCTQEPTEVFIARDVGATRLSRQSYEHYGTRHRSMFRYCSLVPASIGFVISQDGEVRAVTRLEDRIVMWEDIQLRMDGFARVRPRRASAAT